MVRICSIDECDAKHYALDLCRKHWMRVRRTGSAFVVRKSRGPWRGDLVTYSGAHDRIRKFRGPASAQACVECAARADDWAYSHLDPAEKVNPKNGFPYSPDPDFYQPMCHSCHVTFDFSRKKETA